MKFYTISQLNQADRRQTGYPPQMQTPENIHAPQAPLLKKTTGPQVIDRE
jgi:hypothetical protein